MNPWFGIVVDRTINATDGTHSAAHVGALSVLTVGLSRYGDLGSRLQYQLDLQYHVRSPGRSWSK